MEEVIDKFIRDILAQKDLKGVDAYVFEQLVADMSERVNNQINRAILAQLTPEQLEEFENMLDTSPSHADAQAFLKNVSIDTDKTAIDVMKAFRAGYLGQ